MTPPESIAKPRRGRPRNISREDVLEIAARLFNQHGYDRTSLDMIADQLGVTKAGLYYHIANKEEIVLLGCKVAMDQFAARMAATDCTGLNTREILVVHLKSYLELAVTDFGRFLILVDSRALSDAAKEEYLGFIRVPQRIVRNLVEQGIRDGLFRAIDPDIAANGIFGMFNWVCQWRRPPTPEQIPAILDCFVTMLMDGMIPRTTVE
jgi:AcrR family transcriptional regulator